MSNLRMLELREFGESDAAAVSAYVILDNGKLKSHYFLSPSAGGVVVPFESKRVFVITPQSPLGSEIMGRKTGDQFEIESQGQTREYEISGIL